MKNQQSLEQINEDVVLIIAELYHLRFEIIPMNQLMNKWR